MVTCVYTFVKGGRIKYLKSINLVEFKYTNKNLNLLNSKTKQKVLSKISKKSHNVLTGEYNEYPFCMRRHHEQVVFILKIETEH
jgi:hypothetical protein